MSQCEYPEIPVAPGLDIYPGDKVRARIKGKMITGVIVASRMQVKKGKTKHTVKLVLVDAPRTEFQVSVKALKKSVKAREKKV